MTAFDGLRHFDMDDDSPPLSPLSFARGLVVMMLAGVCALEVVALLYVLL